MLVVVQCTQRPRDWWPRHHQLQAHTSIHNAVTLPAGNHFNEWAGFECKWDELPSREQQMIFLRAYLERAAAIRGDAATSVADAEVRSRGMRACLPARHKAAPRASAARTLPRECLTPRTLARCLRQSILSRACTSRRASFASFRPPVGTLARAHVQRTLAAAKAAVSKQASHAVSHFSTVLAHGSRLHVRGSLAEAAVQFERSAKYCSALVLTRGPRVQVERALAEAAAFTQASHAYWGIWAISQARSPGHRLCNRTHRGSRSLGTADNRQGEACVWPRGRYLPELYVTVCRRSTAPLTSTILATAACAGSATTRARRTWSAWSHLRLASKEVLCIDVVCSGLRWQRYHVCKSCVQRMLAVAFGS
jgi:hypothetical protein